MIKLNIDTKNKLASHFLLCHIFELEILLLPKLFCSSKIYYSNATHKFCMNSALPALRAILHLTKNSK